MFEVALGLLPGIFLGLGVVIARGRGARAWREAALVGALLAGVWCVIGTEALSAGRALSRWPLVIWWGAGCAGLAACALWRRRSVRAAGPASAELLDEERVPARRDALAIAYTVAAGAFVCAALVLGALAPPNNADSLSYHLPRQVYWLEQGSVAHFPANNLRQIVMSPFSEYVGVNLMALTGGDVLHNLVQGVALLLVACGASLAARELGAGARGQAFGALAAVSLPGALMQASTTKNDVLVGVWALVLLVCAIRVMRDGAWMGRDRNARMRSVTGLVLMVGASLGLSILTKGTGPIVAFPLCAAIGIGMLVRSGWRAIVPGVAMVALAAALNAGPWARNAALYGGVLGPPDQDGGFALQNESHAPALVASVVIRSVAQHLGTPVEGVNRAIERAVVAAHGALGLGVNDPRVTYHASPEFGVVWWATHEDSCGGPAHVVLAGVLACVIVGWALRRRGGGGGGGGAPWWVIVAASMPFVMFGLMCVLLKWQFWNTRLHVPIGCVLGAVSGVMVGGRGDGVGRMSGIALAFLMSATAAPSVVMNHRRALIGPERMLDYSYQDRVYLGLGDVERERRNVDRVVASLLALPARTVGVAMSGPGPREYLLLRALRRAGYAGRIVVFNAPFGVREPKGRPAPDAVVWAPYRGGQQRDRATRTFYGPHERFGPYTIFVVREGVEELADLYPPSLVSIEDRFRGWRLIDGLGDAEGPYPRLELPSVRWGLGTETRIRVRGVGRAREMMMTCRGNGSMGQGLEVWMGEEILASHEFASARDFETIRVPLGVVRGERDIVIRYLGTPVVSPRDGRPLSVMYSSLVVGRPTIVDESAASGSEEEEVPEAPRSE